jgi:hypothetical protein
VSNAYQFAGVLFSLTRSAIRDPAQFTDCRRSGSIAGGFTKQNIERDYFDGPCRRINLPSRRVRSDNKRRTSYAFSGSGGNTRGFSPQVFHAHICPDLDLFRLGLGNRPWIGIDRSITCGDSRAGICRNLRASFRSARAHPALRRNIGGEDTAPSPVPVATGCALV